MVCKNCGFPIPTPLKTIKEGIGEVPTIEDYTCPNCGKEYEIEGYKGTMKILREYSRDINSDPPKGRKPKKEMPTPKSQKGKPILSFEEWNKLTDCLVEVKPTNSKPPTPPPCQKDNRYRLVTRDEFILEHTTGKLPMNLEHAIKLWEKISKDYNFAIEVEGCLYSVDDTNKLLERNDK